MLEDVRCVELPTAKIPVACVSEQVGAGDFTGRTLRIGKKNWQRTCGLPTHYEQNS